ncbi:DUF6290 family protein [Carnobacteriaceae bacterium 52-44]
MATITVRVSESEKQFLDAMAKFEGKSLSELLKTTTLESLADNYDAIVAEKAYEEYLVDPITIDHEDLMRELEL